MLFPVATRLMGADVTSAQSGPHPEAFHLRHVLHATAVQNCSAHCNSKFRSGTVIPIAHGNMKSQGARHELPTKTVPRAVRKPFGVVRDSYVLSFGFGGFLKPYAHADRCASEPDCLFCVRSFVFWALCASRGRPSEPKPVVRCNRHSTIEVLLCLDPPCARLCPQRA